MTALVAGLMLSGAVSIALTEIFPDTLRGQRDRILWAVNAALGRSGPLQNGDHGHSWVALIAGTISAASLIVGFWIFLRSVRKVRYLSQDEELRVRRLLLEHGERDSLGYFATRRDKAVVFSPPVTRRSRTG